MVKQLAIMNYCNAVIFGHAEFERRTAHAHNTISIYGLQSNGSRRKIGGSTGKNGPQRPMYV